MVGGMKILIIGGSGFVSGTLARRAVEAGHHVWAVTRGNRPLPSGVESIPADRKDTAAFAAAVHAVGEEWDLVADCICYAPPDMAQDVDLFLSNDRSLCGRFVFISTDFVYEPAERCFPQEETDAAYIGEGYGYEKRRCELLLADRAATDAWTVLRPCHIYGPGSLLGCLPDHGRDAELIERIRSRTPLRLVGGGHFLQQPVFAADLADAVLSSPTSASAAGAICNVAGPQIIESRRYYEILGEYLGEPVAIEEIPVDAYLEAHPEKRSFLCHRIYTRDALAAAGLPLPSTGPAEALRVQVEDLVRRRCE